MIMSNQGVDHVIEKKKTNHVMVVFNKVEADDKLEVGTSKGDLEEDFNVMDQPDDLTLGIHAQSPIGIVIAARELGKSDFLSVRHDFSIRKNMGKKAVEEEEGGEKLVEMEIMMSNQGVDHVIEKKKKNHVIVVLYLTWKIGNLEEDFNVIDQPDDLTLVGRYDRYWYSASIAVTITVMTAVQRADRCDDRCNESIGRYDRYSPTVTQGVVAGLRSNWYNLFQVALQAYFLSV
ncbi:hypothetical protein L249_4249 [Ophiocordyceps polyrhachis-furcata BCC 54312]|uniref:Uncharacterized protein n=1 Tax=Ophiocordyceps polyrhachis-furcata BCC 54312 TaxID=1330021 RepID=A0A367L807_9HYPO|nr:hypothetical protein L249_4249 [Ophiocordyceps polyrhachis-furcata BCC 54312]